MRVVRNAQVQSSVVDVRLLAFARARVRRERRRLREEILHRAEHFLLIANPLARRAQRRRDLVDPLREELRIGRQRRLLADQLDLLLDALELGVDERELALGVGPLVQALVQDLDLAAEAAAKLVADRGIGLLPLERGQALPRAPRRPRRRR